MGVQWLLPLGQEIVGGLKKSTTLAIIAVEDGGRGEVVERERRVFLFEIKANVMEEGLLKNWLLTGGDEVIGTVV